MEHLFVHIFAYLNVHNKLLYFHDNLKIPTTSRKKIAMLYYYFIFKKLLSALTFNRSQQHHIVWEHFSNAVFKINKAN